MKTIETLMPVKEGDPISATDWNTILSALKNAELKPGSLLTTSPDIEAAAHAALSAFHIYSVACCPTDDFAYSRCRSKTKAFAEGDLFLVTIDRDLENTQRAFFQPIIYGQPYVLAYNLSGTGSGTGTAGGAPSTGEEWGLLDGGDALDEGGDGFIILSNPDTANQLVWAARVSSNGQHYIAKTGGSGIAARSGTTPGSASVVLYYINDSNVITKKTDSDGADVTKTCYNLSTTAVAANTYIVIERESLSGKFVAVWEDC